MPTKYIRITIFNSSGTATQRIELYTLKRRADGTLTSESSRIIADGIVEVEKGGAMFIERLWAI